MKASESTFDARAEAHANRRHVAYYILRSSTADSARLHFPTTSPHDQPRPPGFWAAPNPSTMADTGTTSAHSADSDTMPRLLQLPREIRDQIYELAWGEDKEVAIRNNGYIFVAQYKGKGGTYQDLIQERLSKVLLDLQEIRKLQGSAWIFTNKQILREGVQEFHRHAFWCCVREAQGLGYSSCSKIRLLPKSSLLKPYTGRFWEIGITVDHDGVHPDDQVKIERLIQSGLGDMYLQQLNLRLILQPGWIPQPRPQMYRTVDVADITFLEMLSCLPKVKKLQITLEANPHSGLWSFFPPKILFDLVFGRTDYKGETMRVGAMLMGKSDCGALHVSETNEEDRYSRKITFTFELSRKRSHAAIED